MQPCAFSYAEIKENMNAKVCRLFNRGRKSDSIKQAEGDLNLSCHKHPITGAYTAQAVLIADSSGRMDIPELNDARCITIAADGLRLRGTEIVNGREYVQEWWCIPQPKTKI